MSWTPVSVQLGDGKEGDDSINHYDSTKLSKKALRDLPVNPGEEVGMFYGLEVCHDYDMLGRSNNQTRQKKKSEEEPVAEKPKKRKRKSSADDNDDDEEEKDKVQATKKMESDEKKKQIIDESKPASDKTKKKKKKQKKEESSTETPVAQKEEEEKREEPIDPSRFLELQQAWLNVLEPRLAESLYRMNFFQPTPIQAATLQPAILGRRNIVGAAPTGSGKTLSFLLPILHHILTAQLNKHAPPQAVIVTPTRELATQIHHECNKLLPGQSATLVGGIALVKQARILQQKRPPIIIGTPGRLWAMISSGEHEHLTDLTQIKFLVLDEADRMTQEHCFPQMLSILSTIHEANPRDEDDDDDDEDESEDDDDDDEERMRGLPGLPGEAKLTLLSDDILEQIEIQRNNTKPEALEVSDQEFDEESENDSHSHEKVHRQTFIYSATLTLPFTSLNEKRKRKTKHGLDGGIAEILDKTQAMGETKVVDLSSTTVASAASASQSPGGVRLPPGLVLAQVKCTQLHKDSHLYAYLMTTSQGASGPCLIFCNSIAAVRRVGKTLECLGMSVRVLHAQMQQRARFKAVESLKDSKSRSVVVCTDVAARGLDIPSVATVVHYDVARSVDAFVHRSGRTARGMGAGAVGTSLSLISPAEDKSHTKIVEALQAKFSKVLLDGRLMTSAQERTNLASKIVAAGEINQKTNSHNKWFLDAAKEADLELDDGLLEDETNMSEKDQLQLKEAKKAKLRLEKLLAEPMKTQRFGKFLSTNSAVMQAEIKPLKQKATTSTKKKKKKKKPASTAD